MMRSIKRMLLLAASAVMAGGSGALAQDANTYAYQLEGLHNRQGTGLYDKIIERASQHGSNVQTKLGAPSRAFRDFRANDIACLVPANTNKFFYDFGENVVQSDPMFTAKVYIFTPRGSEPITDLDALKGKTVGIRAGMEYGRIHDMDLNLIKAPTLKANIRKLEAGRLDAFLAFYPDVYSAFHTLNMERLPHAEDEPVARHADAIICHKDMGGKEIVQSFNQALDTLRDQGVLQKMINDSLPFK